MIIMNETITFNKEKFKETIQYIVNEVGHKSNVGRVVLFKILYFSDFNYYELYEESLTGERYIRNKMGPTPNDFNLAIIELENEGKIKESCETVINYRKFTYTSLVTPELKLLSKKELDVIDEVIKKISVMNSTEASAYSHGDLPWRVAKPSEEIDYEYVFYRSPEYSVRVYDDL